DDPLGIVSKKALLDQILDGLAPDPMAVLHEPLIAHEATTIFNVLEQFKRQRPRHRDADRPSLPVICRAARAKPRISWNRPTARCGPTAAPGRTDLTPLHRSLALNANT